MSGNAHYCYLQRLQYGMDLVCDDIVSRNIPVSLHYLWSCVTLAYMLCDQLTSLKAKFLSWSLRAAQSGTGTCPLALRPRGRGRTRAPRLLFPGQLSFLPSRHACCTPSSLCSFSQHEAGELCYVCLNGITEPYDASHRLGLHLQREHSVKLCHAEPQLHDLAENHMNTERHTLCPKLPSTHWLIPN